MKTRLLPLLPLFPLLTLTAAAQPLNPTNLTKQARSVIAGDVIDPIVVHANGRVLFRADQERLNPNLYSTKVTGGTPTRIGPLNGNYLSHDILPNGTEVLFTANLFGLTELFHSPITGGPVRRLSAPGDFVQDFQVTPDGVTVVFRAFQAGVSELYSVPVAGGIPVKLNGALISGGTVFDYKITPDGSRVVYRARQDTVTSRELYSVPVNGGSEVKVHAAMTGSGASLFKISPDGLRVVYLAIASAGGVLELFSAPVTGGGATRLNAALPAGGRISNFSISPNSARVVYLGEQNTDSVTECFSVLLAGGGLTQLNGALVPNGAVQFATISPDNSRVVYLATEDHAQITELFSVPLAGGVPQKLNAPMATPNQRVVAPQVSPDSSRVVFHADQDTPGLFELYSVPLAGGSAPTRLNLPLLPGGIILTDSNITPDSSRVVYHGRQDDPTVTELYSVPLTGGPVTKLNQAFAVDGNVFQHMIDPSGSHVVFLADAQATLNELFSVPVTGGIVTTLNGPLTIGGSVDMFTFDAKREQVVLIGDLESSGIDELYRIAITGGPPVKIAGPSDPGSDVGALRLSPDNDWVVFRADLDTLFEEELYSVHLDGGGVNKLNPPPAPSGDVSTDFEISPDSRFVVFEGDLNTNSVTELFSTPISGGTPVRLNPPIVIGGDVFSFQFAGNRVVFRGDIQTNNQNEIFSVPVTGGTALRLNDAFQPGQSVNSYRVSPNGQLVVYRANQDSPSDIELFVVNSSSSGSIKLNQNLPTSGGVTDFEISPDGTRVVFEADARTNNVTEIYSVLITGGPVTVLSSPMPSNRDAFDFRISPDSRWVVYRSDQDTDNQFNLYGVPIGGGPAVKLSEAISSSGIAALGYEISPDSTQVVYREDDLAGVTDLYSVPLAGGSVVKLSDIQQVTGDVDSFRFSPDGSRVLYFADPVDVSGLFRVPITGGPSVRLNRDLPPGGIVTFPLEFIDEAANQVLFRGEQDIDGVVDILLWQARAIWASSGGDWFNPANWQDELTPEAGVEALIGLPASARLGPSGTPAEADILYLGGAGLSELSLSGGAVLSLGQGADILSGGTLRGDGALEMGAEDLVVRAGAELRAGAGDRLVLLSGPVGNAGRLEALGTATSPAELEFSGAVDNAAGTGAVVAHDAVVRFAQGATNRGGMSFGNGVNDVFGDISNEPGGLITVSGGALTLFHEDVANNGTINVSAAGSIESSAVFFGSLSGNGVSGGGNVFIEGDARPGFSPGSMHFDGDVSSGPVSVFVMELGGTAAGIDHDEVTVGGHLQLGGGLVVQLINGFTPAAGMRFDLWDAASVSGAFTGVDLPALPSGLYWHQDLLNITGELTVGLVPESYLQFAADNNLTTPPDGDEEGDGLLNIFEYLVAGDPNLSDFPGSLLQHERVGETDFLRFEVAQPAGNDLVVDLETTTDVGNGPGGWSVLASRTGNGSWSGGASQTPTQPGQEEIEVENLTTGEPIRYYRLRLRLLP